GLVAPSAVDQYNAHALSSPVDYVNSDTLDTWTAAAPAREAGAAPTWINKIRARRNGARRSGRAVYARHRASGDISAASANGARRLAHCSSVGFSLRPAHKLGASGARSQSGK